MIFNTLGDKNKPVILFFHAMGVTGESSIRIANYLKDKYFCIMPTSSLYCENQKYISKEDERLQVEKYLKDNNINEIEMIVASSIGADLGIYFLAKTSIKVNHVFFDGGQFAQINLFLRRIMTPFLYFAIKSLYKKNGENLGKIMWCDDKEIRPYFVKAGKELKYSNLHKHLGDSLINKPFIKLDKQTQEKIYFEFGNKEDHFKYLEKVKQAYPYAKYPIFNNYNHMQFQIRDPKGFGDMLDTIITKNELPELEFLLK